jgi:hypothetical protein
MLKIKNNWRFVINCLIATLAVVVGLALAEMALASMFDVYGTSLRFGQTPPDLGSGQNLLYGTIGAGSSGTGSFLLFQKPSGTDKFRVDHNGNVTAAGDVCANGKCLSSLGGSVNASNVTAGTFGAGSFTFPANLTVNGNLDIGGDAINLGTDMRLAQSTDWFYILNDAGSYSNKGLAVQNVWVNGTLYFGVANPTISASSYFIAPGGAYFNSGTVYTEAAIQARGGIHNDTGAYLTISGGTSGATYFSGNVGVGVTTAGANLEVAGAAIINNVSRTGLGMKVYNDISVFNAVQLTESNLSTVNSWMYGPTNALYLGTGSTVNEANATVAITAGSVGIGTNSPAAKLEVSGGPIKASGGFILETRTGSDPASPAVGQMWLRTDL